MPGPFIHPIEAGGVSIGLPEWTRGLATALLMLAAIEFPAMFFTPVFRRHSMMPQEQDNDPRAGSLHPSTKQRVRAVRLGMSLDGWAVLAAIFLAIIVRLGAKIPW